jgi:simple sugar transport system ATP-binding protein
MDAPLVELRNVSKSFGKGFALRNVTFKIGQPELVALVGDNGAGKSTMIRIIAGVIAPSSGEIYVRGQKMDHWSATQARQMGIETVFQDRALAEQQTIARNIFMGREVVGPLGALRVGQEYREASRLMRAIGFKSKVFAPDSVVATLSGGEKQGVAIARALYFKADLIILDEPTTALSLSEAKKVLGFAQHIKEQGSSAIFITHNIYHAHDIADRLVVLDRGQLVADFPKRDITVEQLIQEMHSLAETGDFSLDRYKSASA